MRTVSTPVPSMPSPPEISWRAHSSACSCSVCAPESVGYGSRPRSCTPRHGSPLKRHGPIEIGTAGSTTTSPSSVSRTRTCTNSERAALLAEHDLERVVVAGLERAGLVTSMRLGPGCSSCLAAQRHQEAVGQDDLDRQALDHDLDAGVGVGGEQARRPVGDVGLQHERDVGQLAQHQRLRVRVRVDHHLGDEPTPTGVGGGAGANGDEA